MGASIMKSIQERLREPILGNAYEPKQLLAERQEAANVIDGLVERLGEVTSMFAAMDDLTDEEWYAIARAQGALAAVKANTEGEL